jgi:hypothetical protein
MKFARLSLAAVTVAAPLALLGAPAASAATCPTYPVNPSCVPSSTSDNGASNGGAATTTNTATGSGSGAATTATGSGSGSATLPFTGAEVVPVTLIGLALVGGGTAAIVVSRRKRAAQGA